MTQTAFKLCFFGAFAAEVDGEPMPPLRFKRSLWLLALLALRQGREVPRTWLAETLWPDSEPTRALRNLRQTLADDLRPTLGPAASLLRAPTPATLRIDTSDVWVDVAAFDAAIASGSVAALQSALALYRGPFLEGCLEEWALPERAVREEAFHGALERLAQAALTQGETATAVGHLRHLVSSATLRESGYAALMEALSASGDAAGVRQVYRDLREVLHRQLNSQPSPPTHALYERLQQPEAQPALPQPTRPSTPRRLPVPMTRLIGRESDITEVVDRFTQGRLVTLVGSGGVGKTRLGIAVAEALAADYADGVWFVELGALTDADLVASSVAQALSVKEQSGQTIVETLQRALASRSLLLVLDNCEHLLNASADLIGGLLGGCEELRVLATSREALGLFGEWVYRVPSLGVPPLAEIGLGVEADKNAMSRLLEYESVQLFVERAAAQSATLRLTASQTLAIAEICGELDGLPLAIEMAAARVRTLSIGEIHSRLWDRFGLLRGGDRRSLPRHQTLAALIDWSYDLLSASEQVLLNRLSVFAGGWTLEAAEAVCSDFGFWISDFGLSAALPEGATSGSASEACPESSVRQQRSNEVSAVQNPKSKIRNVEVLDLLTSLVDRSLVVYEEREGQGRYRLLETVRQYGRDRLIASGERDLVLERHRDYFLAFAEEAEPQLEGVEQAAWLDRLEREHDNLRTALESGNPEADLRICGAVWRFWEVRGYLSEGRRWLAGVLTGTDAGERTPARRKALIGAGLLAWVHGDHTAAHHLLEESLALFRELGDKRGIGAALTNLGLVAKRQSDYAAAHTLLEESLALYRELMDTQGVAVSLMNLGEVAQFQGDSGAARTFLEESLTLFRELKHTRGVAYSLLMLGIVFSEQGDYAAARTLLEESLTLFREFNDKRGIAHSLGALGNVSRGQGDYATMRTMYEACLLLCRELGDKHAIAYTLYLCGTFSSEQGDYASARTLLEESLTLYRELENRGDIPMVLDELGHVASEHGDHEAARLSFAESLSLWRDLGDQRGIAYSLVGFAALALAQEQQQRAARLWGAVETSREDIGVILTSFARPRYDRQVARARAELSDGAFATAWAEGRALTMEQAIEYALQEEVM